MWAPPKYRVISYNLKESTILALNEFLSLLQRSTSYVSLESILLRGSQLANKEVLAEECLAHGTLGREGSIQVAHD